MAEAPPIVVSWTGDSFVPANQPMQKRCDQFFVVGETYRIEFREDRSQASHRHFFAAVAEAFRNIPEQYQREHSISTADDFRREALIQNGYADKIDVIADTSESAQAIVRQIKQHGGYAIVNSRGNVHRIYVAKSQSTRAMDKRTFEESKTAVLNTLADIIGTTPHELAANSHPEHPPTEHVPAAGRTVKRTDNQSSRSPSSIPAAKDAAPSDSPGGLSTGSAPPKATDSAAGAGQTESTDGADRIPVPRTFAEYEYHLKAWLDFTKDRGRIEARMLEERRHIWPTLKPDLTAGQIEHLRNLAIAALRKL